MTPRLRKLYGWLGVAPLGGYLALHLWQVWPAVTHGERGFTDRLASTSALPGVRFALAVLVLSPLLAHVVLGLALVARPAEERFAPARGLQWLEAFTGVALLAFVALHFADAALPLWQGRSPTDVYDTLMLSMGTSSRLAAYALGTTAACFHLALGAPRLAVVQGWARSEDGWRRARYASAVLAALLWLGFLNATTHFTAGAAWAFAPAPSEVAPEVLP